MLFAIIIVLIWGIYSFIMKKRLKDKFRLYDPLLPLVIFSVIASISLGLNYIAAAIPNFYDGIGIHNFLAYWIIGEDNWSLGLFEKFFNYSLVISISLLIGYSGLKVIKD